MTMKDKIIGIILIVPLTVFIFGSIYILSVEYEFIRTVCSAVIIVIILSLLVIMAIGGYILITDA